MSTLIFFFEIPADLLISVIAYLINLSTERLAEQQIIECMVRLECTCCFQFWNFNLKSQHWNQRHTKKKSALYLMKDYRENTIIRRSSGNWWDFPSFLWKPDLLRTRTANAGIASFYKKAGFSVILKFSTKKSTSCKLWVTLSN